MYRPIFIFHNKALSVLLHVNSDFHFSLQTKYFFFKKHVIELSKREKFIIKKYQIMINYIIMVCKKTKKKKPNNKRMT